MGKTLVTGDISSERQLLIWYVKKGVAFSKALLEIQCILATMAENNSLFQNTANESSFLFMAIMTQLIFFSFETPLPYRCSMTRLKGFQRKLNSFEKWVANCCELRTLDVILAINIISGISILKEFIKRCFIRRFLQRRLSDSTKFVTNNIKTSRTFLVDIFFSDTPVGNILDIKFVPL